jgi:hypothetical protein
MAEAHIMGLPQLENPKYPAFITCACTSRGHGLLLSLSTIVPSVSKRLTSVSVIRYVQENCYQNLFKSPVESNLTSSHFKFDSDTAL